VNLVFSRGEILNLEDTDRTSFSEYIFSVSEEILPLPEVILTTDEPSISTARF
jgi:hypothetical protein